MKRKSKRNILYKTILMVLAACAITGCSKPQMTLGTTEEAPATALETMEPTEETTQVINEDAAYQLELQRQAEIVEFQNAKRKNYYGGIVQAVKYGMEIEDGFFIERADDYTADVDSGDDFSDRYAICDIDADGIEELVISVRNTMTAAMLEIIYEFNPETDELKRELFAYPDATYYSNGAVQSPWSHNQGLAGDFYPFDLYAYDAALDSYTEVGSVDAWDKQSFPKDYNGNAFPDELDLDGDGMLYYLMDSEGNGNDTLHDGAEYQAWIQSYIGAAEQIEIPWESVANNHCEQYTAEYIPLVLKKIKDGLSEEMADMGLLFVESDYDYASVENILQTKFNILIGQSEVEYARQGKYNGVTVYYAIEYTDGSKGGGIEYCDEKIENLELFGLYPGMTKDESLVVLKENGF